MGQRKIVSLAVIAALLFIVVFLGVGCARGGGDQERVKGLEQEAATLRSEKEALQGRVDTLEAEVTELRQGGEIRRMPKEGWQQYFPEGAETALRGESTARVRELLGEPPFLIRSIAVNQQYNREIWIFAPFDQDPTGLYLFFKGGKLNSAELNEFNGLPGSGLLDREDFWTR